MSRIISMRSNYIFFIFSWANSFKPQDIIHLNFFIKCLKTILWGNIICEHRILCDISRYDETTTSWVLILLDDFRSSDSNFGIGSLTNNLFRDLMLGWILGDDRCIINNIHTIDDLDSELNGLDLNGCWLVRKLIWHSKLVHTYYRCITIFPLISCSYLIICLY